MTHGATNTRELKGLKLSLIFSEQQREIVVGTILGDGSLLSSRSGLAARLQIRHQHKHQEYVEWKYLFFADWVLTRPRLDRFNNSWYFRTVSHPALMEIKKLFYIENKRQIPEDIANILKSPISLAVWLMDDGNGWKSYAGFRISSYGFGLEGNILLQQCLEQNFSLKTTILKDSKGYQLFFPKQSALALYQLVKPYIVNCMQYKFAALTP